ncbi:MAG: hypothetical protein HYV07_33750 [Deltaproteobacteria bacterium]|nr:hypothetical protein [Deltaproteobacteria bacterium]
MERVRVRFERDENGRDWNVELVSSEVSGVHSYGRSIREARRNIREALAAAVGEDLAAEVAFDEEFVLPGGARSAVARALELRAQARSAELAASSELERVASELVRDRGISVRDAAELLELSHVRISQIVGPLGGRQPKQRRRASV